MIAFEIHINGRRLCTAGVGEAGVVGAHVYWVRRKKGNIKTAAGKSAEEELTLDVGGMTAEMDQVRWRRQSVKVGDEIRIRIMDRGQVDEPASIEQRNPNQELRAQKKYVRQMAKKWGWRIERRAK